MPRATPANSEWLTRKQKVDPKLTAAGWKVVRCAPGRTLASYDRCAVTEYPTQNGPADYALVADGQILGIVEAKKLTLGPQNVLTQAERYSRGATLNPLYFDGFRVPFLYATNGEVLWHHDVRHPLNRSRRLSGFHTPDALLERLGDDFQASVDRLLDTPNDHPRLRPYQTQANEAVEGALGERKRHMLLAMATGTGKTFTLVNQIYRLMKAGVARRVLFLVDRKALAAQAVRAFASFEPEPGLKFDKIYEVYSQRFQRENIEDEPFDPNVLPQSYLVDPQPGHAFVYVSTIQRMTINLFGQAAKFGADEEAPEDEAGELDIPIHAFDLIVADECHRGYTASDLAIWRQTLEHFDAVQVGLTATPAAHTTAYFKHLVYRYEYERAVAEGFLVDYDVVNVESDVRLNGVFLREGEQVELVDPESGAQQLDLLEDERQYEAAQIERRVTSPDSNRKILEEIRRYAERHEERTGRFPKTLIFAVNDLPHTSHADQLVDAARDVFGRGEAFVQKITGRVDRPLQRIREFRNRPRLGVVVTVELLSTGVDIPDLEFIVFLRPVKSRILFEQMLGRGTRRGEHFPDKASFTVFDCFAGTLLQYFKSATSITADLPSPTPPTLAEIIDDIWQNRDRDRNVAALVKRLQRTAKEMSGEAQELFAAHIPGGDLARFAADLPRSVQQDFLPTLAILRNPTFQDLLVHYPRRKRERFVVAYGAEDTVTSTELISDGTGKEYRPEDYLAAFSRFVHEHEDEIEALQILLGHPEGWNPEVLKELRQSLSTASPRFTPERLEKAHRLHYRKALADIISMVKHAAREDEPLFTAVERVERAFLKVTAGEAFTAEQRQWLDRIRAHLVENLSIEREDFDMLPVFARAGGWGRADRAFLGRLPGVLRRFNEAVASAA